MLSTGLLVRRPHRAAGPNYSLLVIYSICIISFQWYFLSIVDRSRTDQRYQPLLRFQRTDLFLLTRTSITGRPVVFTFRGPWRSYRTPKWFEQIILHLNNNIIIFHFISLKYEFQFQRPVTRSFTNHRDHHKHGNQYHQSCCYSYPCRCRILLFTATE